MFAGKWRCERSELFDGDTIVIEEGGDASSWHVEGPRRAGCAFVKVDLLDLVERTGRHSGGTGGGDTSGGGAESSARIHVPGARGPAPLRKVSRLSADDAGCCVLESAAVAAAAGDDAAKPTRAALTASSPPSVLHHIGSLSPDGREMLLSLEYGDTTAQQTRMLASGSSSKGQPLSADDAAPTAVRTAFGFGPEWAAGHHGRRWTLRRVGHVGRDFLHAHDSRPHRWYKHRQLERSARVRPDKPAATAATDAVEDTPPAVITGGGGGLLVQPSADAVAEELSSPALSAPGPAVPGRPWCTHAAAAATLTDSTSQYVYHNDRGMLEPLQGAADAKERAFAAVFKSRTVEMRTVGV